ncbi:MULTISPECIES: hypothetical protein [Bacillus]|uniref:hypothetical protein n=1 Tax=Bacillus TaxID=1386 RepID=UPI0015963907|nr:hypothetical protein [Bacillus cereus]
MKPRRFEYLICYTFYRGNQMMIGNYTFDSRTKLNSKKDIQDLTKLLMEINNAHNVLINNIHFLRAKRAIR